MVHGVLRAEAQKLVFASVSTRSSTSWMCSVSRIVVPVRVRARGSLATFMSPAQIGVDARVDPFRSALALSLLSPLHVRYVFGMNSVGLSGFWYGVCFTSRIFDWRRFSIRRLGEKHPLDHLWFVRPNAQLKQLTKTRTQRICSKYEAAAEYKAAVAGVFSGVWVCMDRPSSAAFVLDAFVKLTNDFRGQFHPFFLLCAQREHPNTKTLGHL